MRNNSRKKPIGEVSKKVIEKERERKANN